ncbi:Tudor domain-containing protein [Caenorhabditis elegans]|uniref:Tudor domain-containing protein n=1 Tax=Caenorhabditis elegans TaxID=6239 RepID=Q19731_CAEEL|nr:Tudor domain-containing protein [Caenorhabditis elegans]CAA95818.1 Tudor domain-containing protein [Caenorhabditis elegans]|eukprot:NP_492009.1 Uncharacterized protein CELE_F22D6.6 [Caenorhabditis elegans]
MIAVGLRLTDEVFPNPEEPIAKLPTGNENPEMLLDGVNKDGKTRIKRIVLSRSANVEFLRAESPSRIWVRLTNHITDSALTFREPFELTQKTTFKIGDYALAPTDERVYRRCRIVDVCRNNELLKVFFIDDAVIAWVQPECLGELDQHYMYYPWQAIQVSMFGATPTVDVNRSTEQLWSPIICDQLSKVLEQFFILRVEVVLSTVVFNDYAKPIPVNLFGIEADIDEKDQIRRAIEIGPILERQEPVGISFPEFFDAAYHQVFEVAERETIPNEALEIHRSFPTDWKKTSISEDQMKEEKEKALFSKNSLIPEMEHSDWDPRQNSIEMLSIDQLEEKFKFPYDSDVAPAIMLAVEGRCTKSPFEWYARPIVKTGRNANGEMVIWNDEEQLKEVDPVDWMIYGNDQLLSMAEQLDTYYSNPKNRKPLKAEEIQSMRKEKRDVFAVCAVNEEKAMYTGEWQRVLIVECDTFAEVRFLDSGGRDMVLTGSLYKIHRQHCRFPPMCLRLSMHGITSSESVVRKWTSAETSRFRTCLREDVPIFINIDDIAPLILPPDDKKDPRAHMAKHVLMVSDVSYMDESKSLLDRFTDKDEAVRAAFSQKEPIEWPN